jgi:oligopeptide/dipeptide ABC transporter ATP-binding protein
MLLSVEDLRVEFRAKRGWLPVLSGVSLSVSAGQTLAVLGESGCGKSVSARAVMGLVRPPRGRITGGAIRLEGADLLTMPSEARRRLRATTVAMVFQDALSALNPVLTVGSQIAELFRVHRGMSRGDARRAAVEVLDMVRIPAAAARYGDYPHQFSGGMRQRAGIAMAIALRPKVIIADEPTTALDVTIQAQIIRLLGELQREHDMALVLISHDMGVVADLADRVAVMYAGRVVEEAPAVSVYRDPAHPYTRALLGAVPRAGHELTVIPGGPPPPGDDAGCAFRSRCAYRHDACEVSPAMTELGPGRSAACHLAEVRR